MSYRCAIILSIEGNLFLLSILLLKRFPKHLQPNCYGKSHIIVVLKKCQIKIISEYSKENEINTDNIHFLLLSSVWHFDIHIFACIITLYIHQM